MCHFKSKDFLATQWILPFIKIPVKLQFFDTVSFKNEEILKQNSVVHSIFMSSLRCIFECEDKQGEEHRGKTYR